VLTTFSRHLRRNLACLGLAVIAALLVAAGGTGSAATGVGPWLLADQPELFLTPHSTGLSRVADTEAGVYLPASMEMARLVLYIPAGYRVDLTKAPGAEVGLVVAWSGASTGAPGRLTAADPASYATNTCAPGTHQAVWLLTLANASLLPPVPFLVDTTSGSDTALGGYKAQACLPPSSSGSMRIRELDLDLSVLTNPSATGAYHWRAFVTPYAGGAPNSSGTFELRATVPLPMQLTLRGRYDRKHKRAVLTGRLIAPAYDTSGVPLDLYLLNKGRLRYLTWRSTRSAGRYSFTRRIKKTTRFVTVTSSYDDCEPGTIAPAGCVSDTLADVFSNPAKVVVRRRR
jgi:hypothetical protein